MLVFAVVALLTAGLTACGDGGSSSSTAATATGPAATTPSESSENDSSSSTGTGAGSKGEGSASFEVKGGDNSIQNYGDEADAAEREAVEAVVADYLDARTSNDWAGQCADLAKVVLKPIEQLSQGSPQLKGKSCPALIEAFSGNLPASARANPMTNGLASVRVKDDRAFALFRDDKGVPYSIPMVEEDGEWKVAGLVPSEFP